MSVVPMIPYLIGTFIVLILTAAARERDVSEAYIVVTGSWLLWCTYIVLSWAIGYPDFEPWHAGIVIDAVAAYYLYRHPTNKIKATIAAIYCLQIIIHMAYGGIKISHTPDNGDVYAGYLSITGWFELLLLGGWSGGHAWRRLDPVRWLVRSYRRSAHHRDMGPRG